VLHNCFFVLVCRPATTPESCWKWLLSADSPSADLDGTTSVPGFPAPWILSSVYVDLFFYWRSPCGCSYYCHMYGFLEGRVFL